MWKRIIILALALLLTACQSPQTDKTALDYLKDSGVDFEVITIDKVPVDGWIEATGIRYYFNRDTGRMAQAGLYLYPSEEAASAFISKHARQDKPGNYHAYQNAWFVLIVPVNMPEEVEVKLVDAFGQIPAGHK